MWVSETEKTQMSAKKRENKIRARAFKIFQESGGNEKDNWIQATKEVDAKELLLNPPKAKTWTYPNEYAGFYD